jgi:hypothetical protein
VYQKAMENAIKRAMHADEVNEKKRQRKLAKGLASTAPTPPATNPPTPGAHTRRHSHSVPLSAGTTLHGGDVEIDINRDAAEVTVKRRRWFGLLPAKQTEEETGHAVIRPSLRDINPLPTMWSLLKEPTNAIILCSSSTISPSLIVLALTIRSALRCPVHYPLHCLGHSCCVSSH